MVNITTIPTPERNREERDKFLDDLFADVKGYSEGKTSPKLVEPSTLAEPTTPPPPEPTPRPPAAVVPQTKEPEEAKPLEEKEEIESYPLYYEDGKVITIIKGQTWSWTKNGKVTTSTISSIRPGKEKGILAVSFNKEEPLEDTVDEWKRVFESATFVSDNEGKLIRAKIGEVVEYSNRNRRVEPKEAAGVTYEDGRIVDENIVRPPQVEVPEPVVEAPKEPEVPPAVEKADKEISQAVEAVPAVAAEEEEEAKEIQEPPTDTTPQAGAIASRQKMVSAEGDAGAEEAAGVEGVWSPLEK